MRSIVLMVFALLGLGFLASAVPLAAPEQPREASPPWRRTVDGWQRAYWLDDHAGAGAPQVHPLAFGVFMLTAAVSVPVALSKPDSPRKNGGQARPLHDNPSGISCGAPQQNFSDFRERIRGPSGTIT